MTAPATTVDLDPLPDVPPIVKRLQVAAAIAFVDPPPAYSIDVTEYDVRLQGWADSGLDQWALSHGLTLQEEPHSRFEHWSGRISGVWFRVSVGVQS